MKIEVLYHDENMPEIQDTEKGDWYDLCVVDVKGKHAHQYEKWLYDSIVESNKKAIIPDNDAFVYCAGDFLLLNLGVSIKMPLGYEAHVVPRSSTFKNWGFIQTNGVGIIDNTYCGPNDVWFMPVYCTRAGVISRYSRVCQFRVIKNQDARIVKVDSLDGIDRGGHGSTGV